MGERKSFGSTDGLIRRRQERQRLSSRHLDSEQREKFRDLLELARENKGWSSEKTARSAVVHLRAYAALPQHWASAREVELWRTVQVTHRHVARMPAMLAPMLTAERRARLFGVCLALGIDLAEVNRFGGGL